MYQLRIALLVYRRAEDAQHGNWDYNCVRWVAKMTAVEIHGIWERYVENRLIAALNHHPEHFLNENSIKSVKRVSLGLATYIVRGGGRYFDFRSMADLSDKSKRWLGNSNPFLRITKGIGSYIDALAAVRNCVVHGSDAAVSAYKRNLKSVYSIKYAPTPDEFLHAKDLRITSPARNKSRLDGLATVVEEAIESTGK